MVSPARPRLVAVALAWLALGCGRSSLLELPNESATVGADAGVDLAVDDLARAPLTCVAGDIAVVAAVPSVMMVLDRSQSMRTVLPGAGGRSRWQVLTDALASVLPPVDGVIALGAAAYPDGAGGGACEVSGAPQLEPLVHHVFLLTALMRGTTPRGATPTADAIDVAAQDLTSQRAGQHARALVLATDGAPDCNAALDPRTCTCTSGGSCRNDATRCLDGDRTSARIAAWAQAGLPTYVIGIAPSTEPALLDTLDAMAIAGGKAKAGAHAFYSAGSSAELESALTAIRDQVGACTFLSTSIPDGNGSIGLTIDGTFVPEDDSGAHGWRWGVRDNGEIVLSDDYCGQVGSAATTPSIVAHITCGDGG